MLSGWMRAVTLSTLGCVNNQFNTARAASVASPRRRNEGSMPQPMSTMPARFGGSLKLMLPTTCRLARSTINRTRHRTSLGSPRRARRWIGSALRTAASDGQPCKKPRADGGFGQSDIAREDGFDERHRSRDQVNPHRGKHRRNVLLFHAQSEPLNLPPDALGSVHRDDTSHPGTGRWHRAFLPWDGCLPIQPPSVN